MGINNGFKSQEKSFNLNSFLLIVGFLLTFAGSIGSYFKAIIDIRTEIQSSLYAQADTLRKEFHDQYATKEEAAFIQSTLTDIKIDLKEIKQAVNKK